MPKFHQPATLSHWIARIQAVGVPVLQQTADALDALREDEDAVDAQTIASIVLDDPLMTLKVLAHMARHRSRRVEDDVVTVNSAVLLMGVPPFLRQFRELETVESLLADYPLAAEGALKVVRRSHRAARLALAFSTHRADVQAEVLHEAALLHDFVELLVWCHAPALALELARRTAEVPRPPRAEIEKAVLGVELNEVEQALMTAWRLPKTLAWVTDDKMSGSPRVRTVLLASRIARHSEGGWHTPPMQRDFDALGHLLGLTPAIAMQKTVELLGEATAETQA